MIEIPSAIEDKIFMLPYLEEELKPLGYVIGGNWDYNHGSFDYKMAEENGYQFLRVPFEVVDGQLDLAEEDAKVKLKRPYLLSHEYESGLDDTTSVSPLNQFASPKNPDATFPKEYIQIGKDLVNDLERTLLH